MDLCFGVSSEIIRGDRSHCVPYASRMSNHIQQIHWAIKYRENMWIYSRDTQSSKLWEWYVGNVKIYIKKKDIHTRFAHSHAFSSLTSYLEVPRLTNSVQKTAVRRIFSFCSPLDTCETNRFVLKPLYIHRVFHKGLNIFYSGHRRHRTWHPVIFSYGDMLKTMPTNHKLQDRIRAAVQTIDGNKLVSS